MIAELLLALAVSVQGRDGGPDGTEEALVASRGGGNAHWELEKNSLQVGDVVHAKFVVEHAPNEKVEIDFAPLDADLAWILAASPQIEASKQSDWLSATATTWSVQLAVLEPGEHELPVPKVEVVTADGTHKPVSQQPAKLTVAGVLGANEDSPRPVKDFRPVEPEITAGAARWITALIGAALIAAIGLILWLRRKKSVPAPPEPSSLERVEQLAARDLDSAEIVRALHYELTQIVRKHFDALDGHSRKALTDEEWIAAVASLRPALVDEITALLRVADAAKYGPEQPTAWAVKESLERAKRLIQMAGVPAAVTA